MNSSCCVGFAGGTAIVQVKHAMEDCVKLEGDDGLTGRKSFQRAIDGDDDHARTIELIRGLMSDHVSFPFALEARTLNLYSTTMLICRIDGARDRQIIF